MKYTSVKGKGQRLQKMVVFKSDKQRPQETRKVSSYVRFPRSRA